MMMSRVLILCAFTLMGTMERTVKAQGFATADAKLPQPGGLLGGSLLGRSVAADGDRVLAGAPIAENGRVLVFERQADESWATVSELDTGTLGLSVGDFFGGSVDLDGDRAIVGALRYQIGGAAFVFERQADATWVPVVTLTGSDAGVRDFGDVVVIEGDRAVVGAPAQKFGLQYQVGAVYVFERQPNGAWSEVAMLTASDGTAFDRFGESVGLAGDFVVGGAPGWDGPFFGQVGFGASYVFERLPSEAWIERARLLASDPGQLDRLGTSVAITPGRVVVGAPGADSGAGYVFDQQPGGSWQESSKLVLGPSGGPGYMGMSAAMEGDRVLLGAPTLDATGTDSGAAVLYERDPSGVWAEVARFVASDHAASDVVGQAVALDGGRVVFAAENKDGPGAVYAVDRAPLLRGQHGVSLSTGGSQGLLVRPGASFAGQVYLVLGSFAGISPGLPFYGLTLPLNADPYFGVTLAQPAATLTASVGFLDSAGRADVSFALPAGQDPVFAGLVAHHAFVLFDVSGPVVATVVSNPVAVTLLP